MSYTIVAGANPITAGRIEVQLNNRCFYIKRIYGGALAEKKVLSWRLFRTMMEAWEAAKSAAKFDEAAVMDA